MAIIHILDKHTAELIAAGEVVERPASALKELVENAIDAGSTVISVAIERGGVGLMEVADNGSGIEPEYLPAAFIRHATSKITTGADLEAIGTLGFRGEALASIAAVAKVTLTTKTPSAEFATAYRIEGGEEQEALPAARDEGTTVVVRDLFYNTPARMKFLKKDQSEGNLCQDVVMHLALSHPEISFRFAREGKNVFTTPGDGRRLSAIYAVLGRSFAVNLCPVQFDRGDVRLEGYVSKPAAARGNRSMQHFYINDRYVKNKTMQAGLEAACKGFLMGGKFPSCVLAVTMPLEKVDVNVHPAKTEVRFSDEKEIFYAIYQGVKAALSTPAAGEKQMELRPADNASPTTEEKSAAQTDGRIEKTPVLVTASSASSTAFNVKAKAITPESEQTTPGSFFVAQPSVETGTNAQQGTLLSTSYTPYRINTNVLDIAVEGNEAPANQPLKKVERNQAVPDEDAKPGANTMQATMPADQPVELRYIGEAFNTYVVAQHGDVLCFIDKHAAHERMLYEKLMAGMGSRGGQMLLQPLTLLLSGEEKNALLQAEALLENAGFAIEDFGGNTVLVRSVPQDMSIEEVAPAVEEIAEKMLHGSDEVITEKQQWVYASVACRAAIKAGNHSSAMELLQLAQDIIDGKIPLFCPHGRPVLLKLTQKELEKNFGRIV